MKIINLAAIVIFVALSGCAHPMIISPDIQSLKPTENISRVPKNVGLYIPSVKLPVQVTTAGGGGDRVTYHPYSDMESGLYKMLANVFTDVKRLKYPNEATNAMYVVEPEISTKSWSTGIFTWMATDFQVKLTCKLSDASGNSLGVYLAEGTGHAVFDELKSDFSLAGERASQDALQKMQNVLLNAPELRR